MSTLRLVFTEVWNFAKDEQFVGLLRFAILPPVFGVWVDNICYLLLVWGLGR